MKKLLMVGILSTSLILTACGNKEPENTELENLDTNHQNQQETLLPNNNEITMTCSEAIQEYLNNANLEGEGAEIKAGDNITVDYIGRLDNETVFDTSVESVAKACGTYAEGRNYTEGLSFDVGAGQMIAGFDTGVVGMKIGQTKTVTIPATEAYGEIREDLIMTFPLSDIPNADDFQEGMTVYMDMGASAKITKKTDKEITLDMNHELAGKDLIFDITIKSIN